MTVAATPTNLLALASQFLEGHQDTLSPSWARAVAFLTRQALEDALDELWQSRHLEMGPVSARAQLLCLGTYLKDDDLTAELRHAWGALSRGCHHHPYELAPTAGELRRWFEVTNDLVDRVRTADVTEDEPE